MKVSKPSFRSFLSLERAKCKSANMCSFFSTSSYTCTHGGGDYCGKYRTLKQAKRTKTDQDKQVFGILCEPLNVENQF